METEENLARSKTPGLQSWQNFPQQELRQLNRQVRSNLVAYLC